MKQLTEGTGTENPYAIGHELGEEMTEASTVIKSAERLARARRTLDGLRERYARVVPGCTWRGGAPLPCEFTSDQARFADADAIA